MTREILFRGKRLDNGEWEDGFYVRMHDSKGRVAHKIHSGYTDNIYGNFYSDDLSPEGVEVDPSTVGQYTGLCDKNGKKIFEGDIACFCEENQLPRYCIITHGEYSVGHIGFYTAWYKGGSTVKYFRKDLGFWVEHEKIEVIGNIHDNPELLEGEG